MKNLRTSNAPRKSPEFLNMKLLWIALVLIVAMGLFKVAHRYGLFSVASF